MTPREQIEATHDGGIIGCNHAGGHCGVWVKVAPVIESLTAQLQVAERERDAWHEHYNRAVDENIEDISDSRAELQAAQAKLVAIRSIGANSGTDLNAWNKAFDVLDAADTSAFDAAILTAKAKVLREASDAIDGRFSHVKEGEIPFHPGEELDGHMMQPHVRGMIQRWLRARAASIEQTEADRG